MQPPGTPPDGQPPSPAEPPTLAELTRLRGAVGPRNFHLALTYDLRYVEPPARASSETLRATLAPAEDPGTQGRAGTSRPVYAAHAELSLRDGVQGSCSRRPQTFGPCIHVATMAIDLALSSELRSALVKGVSTEEPASRARALRAELRAEVHLETALAAWAPIRTDGPPVEILGPARRQPSATPRGAAMANAGTTRGPPSSSPSGRRASAGCSRAGRSPPRLSRRATAASSSTRAERARAQGGVRHRRRGHARTRGHARPRRDLRGRVQATPRLPLGARAAARRARRRTRARGRPRAPIECLSLSWVTDDGAHVRSLRRGLGVLPRAASLSSGPRSGAIYRVAPDVDPDFARLARARPVAARAAQAAPRRGRRSSSARRAAAGVVLPAARGASGLPAAWSPRASSCASRASRSTSPASSSPSTATRGIALPGPRREPAGAEPARGGTLEPRPAGSRARRARASLDAGRRRRRGRARSGGESRSPAKRRSPSGTRASSRSARRSDPPIEVELSERLARVRVGAPLTGRVHVALEGDWLGDAPRVRVRRAPRRARRDPRRARAASSAGSP